MYMVPNPVHPITVERSAPLHPPERAGLSQRTHANPAPEQDTTAAIPANTTRRFRPADASIRGREGSIGGVEASQKKRWMDFQSAPLLASNQRDQMANSVTAGKYGSLADLFTW